MAEMNVFMTESIRRLVRAAVPDDQYVTGLQLLIQRIQATRSPITLGGRTLAHVTIQV
jgi:hypothetical protein